MSSRPSALHLPDDATETVAPRADAAEMSFDVKRLPPELRDEIWAFALPTDRVLLATMNYDVLRPLSVPVIAWVCRESRDVALRHGDYYPIVKIGFPPEEDGDTRSKPRQTWFAPDFDRVMLHFSNHRNTEFQRGSCLELAPDVRHVLVHDTYTYDHQWNQRHPRHAASLRRTGLRPADISIYPNIRSIGVVQTGAFIEKGSDWNHWDGTKNFSATGIPRRVRPRESTSTHFGQPAVCSCSDGPEAPPANWHWLPDLARPYNSKGLWRMLRSWFEMHHRLWTPHAAESDAPMDVAWVTQTKRRAPHVYPAEVTGYGNRHLRATPGPRCMHLEGTTYDWVRGEDLLERLVGDPGDVDVDQQQVAEPTGPWPIPAISPAS